MVDEVNVHNRDSCTIPGLYTRGKKCEKKGRKLYKKKSMQFLWERETKNKKNEKRNCRQIKPNMLALQIKKK